MLAVGREGDAVAEVPVAVHLRGLSPQHLEVVEPPIPKTIKFAEAPAAGRSILATSRSSKGAIAYREVAQNLVERASRPKKKVAKKPARAKG
ncbi:hypothetical protein Pve01_92640 [Planomonospora venezuelensis]|nr:hypothetical protein Pve01_92640 [Planomonospora venezuelensis]